MILERKERSRVPASLKNYENNENFYNYFLSQNIAYFEENFPFIAFKTEAHTFELLVLNNVISVF